MAVAPFFDKAALGASQVLQGFDFKAFQEALERQVVGVAFDEAACSHEGRATLDLTVNLLARLYPSLTFRASGDGEGIRADLQSLAKAINPVIVVEEDFSRATVVLTVGETPSKLEVPTFYLGSNGWLAKVSQVGPVGSGESGNPYGALAAACFGTANLFRLVFQEWLPHGELDHDILLSLDNYERDSLATNSVLEPADAGETYLVGVGAIGNAAVYALARTWDVAGDLHLIDPETVDTTNPQRYLPYPGQRRRQEQSSGRRPRTQARTHSVPATLSRNVLGAIFDHTRAQRADARRGGAGLGGSPDRRASVFARMGC